MLERIVLAVVMTFCIYLFLNLGGNSSKLPVFEAQEKSISSFLNQARFLSW